MLGVWSLGVWRIIRGRFGFVVSELIWWGFVGWCLLFCLVIGVNLWLDGGEMCCVWSVILVISGNGGFVVVCWYVGRCL